MKTTHTATVDVTFSHTKLNCQEEGVIFESIVREGEGWREER